MGDSYGQWSSRATKHENSIWAIRLLLICIGIASCIALLKAVAIPYTTTFVVDTIPCIWNSGRVLFSPPYVYIIVNCIIIAIAASTSFHQQNNLSRKPERTHTSLYSEKSQVLEPEFTEKEEAMTEETPPSAAPSSNLSKNSGATLRDRSTLEKPGKKSPESENRKLPDEQEDDIMDSIRKAIMEGQGKQPTTQLKKSDMRKTATPQTLNKAEPVYFGKRAFRKIETFTERMTAVNATIVAKEKSMGQDELKLRIEAFIRKNYDDMRLQKEE